MTRKLLSFVFTAMLVPCMGTVAHAQVVTNGGFEDNGGPSTTTLTAWTQVDRSGCNGGDWFAQKGTNPPVTPVRSRRRQRARSPR